MLLELRDCHVQFEESCVFIQVKRHPEPFSCVFIGMRRGLLLRLFHPLCEFENEVRRAVGRSDMRDKTVHIELLPLAFFIVRDVVKLLVHALA